MARTMQTILRILALTSFLLLVGCGEPTINGSSEDDFYHSAGRMALSLPVEEREAFSDALILVAMDGMDFTADPAEGEQLDFEGAIERLDPASFTRMLIERSEGPGWWQCLPGSASSARVAVE
ncbi:hypothetical protein LWH48_06515 [Halomonas sp. G15]|uniref:DUF6694 family lipoprotein n=1 Tax=Halomonas sp. G15 TaxID=2903521 RepID=UPI001E32B4C0|nr:DUF6694 family lipoprotein [Halomonas sp. G15]MCE0732455.1 hypothetical protein [Halomonas sp. G15]